MTRSSKKRYRSRTKYVTKGSHFHKMFSRPKGVGEGGGGAGGGGGHVPPHFQKWGAQVGLCPHPHFWAEQMFYIINFTFCSYFVVKNTIFSKFSWLASLAKFNKSIFSKLCSLYTLEYFFLIYSFLIA